MNDPFGSMNNLLNQYSAFMQNPIGFLAQRNMNVPANIQNNPQAIIQHLMNSGQMNQAQFNGLRQLAGQIQQNPQFQQFFR